MIEDYILLFNDLYRALIIFAANNQYTMLKLYQHVYMYAFLLQMYKLFRKHIDQLHK